MIDGDIRGLFTNTPAVYIVTGDDWLIFSDDPSIGDQKVQSCAAELHCFIDYFVLFTLKLNSNLN